MSAAPLTTTPEKSLVQLLLDEAFNEIVAASGINHFASQKGVGGPAGFKRTILTSYRDIPPFQFYLLTLIFGPVLLAQKSNRQGHAQNRSFMPGSEAAAPFEPVC